MASVVADWVLVVTVLPLKLLLADMAVVIMVLKGVLSLGFLCVVSRLIVSSIKHVCARAALTQTFSQLSRNFAGAQKVGFF